MSMLAPFSFPTVMYGMMNSSRFRLRWKWPPKADQPCLTIALPRARVTLRFHELVGRTEIISTSSPRGPNRNQAFEQSYETKRLSFFKSRGDLAGLHIEFVRQFE